MIDALSRIGTWLNKNWSSTLELTLLCFVLSSLFVTFLVNRIRIKKTTDIYNFVHKTRNVNIIVNDLEALRANHERMENLVQEINTFHNGAKRQIIKKQVALSILEQRLKVLREVFKDPLESYRSVCELVTKGNMSTRELID